MNPLISPSHTGHSQLRRLIGLRSISIAGQILVLSLANQLLEFDLAWLPMSATILAEILINLGSWWRLRYSEYPVGNAELFAQLCIDVLALSILLYYSGGSTNPFISLYLLSLIIAAATLPRVYTWLMAFITTACYSLLMLWYKPLPAINSHAHQHGNTIPADSPQTSPLLNSITDFCTTRLDGSQPLLASLDNAFNTHVIGMWLGFVISAIVIAYFVVKMANAVRERDDMLARIREDNLRNERVVELGMQAAGAAHEMGTPLSTMLVVLGELKHDATAIPEWQANLDLLEGQVRGCKRILDKMLSNAKDNHTRQSDSIEKFMHDTLDEWQLLRPAAKYTYHSSGSQPAPLLHYEPSLRAALMNLLNNAADASPDKIDIHASWNDSDFTLEISDYGSGLKPATASRIGTAFFTTKEDGRGLGLFLSNTTLERLGGKVRLFNRTDGGATTRVNLPLASAT